MGSSERTWTIFHEQILFSPDDKFDETYIKCKRQMSSNIWAMEKMSPDNRQNVHLCCGVFIAGVALHHL